MRILTLPMLQKASDLSAHEARVDNPHSVNKNQVGLSNVDNTSDASKPLSSAKLLRP